MEHTATTISKEQYERLERLAGKTQPDFTINKKQHGFDDLLGSFLKEQVAEKNIENKANNDVNFYKLVESLLN